MKNTNFSESVKLKRDQGFTIIEFVVTITVTAVLVSIAVPTMAALVSSSRMQSDVNSLFSHLQFARSEAIKRGEHIVLCRSNDGETCSAGSSWEKGWMLFSDGNRNHQIDEDEQILRIQQPLYHNISIDYRSLQTSWIMFKPDGSASFNSSYIFCDLSDRTQAHRIVVYYSGQTRITTQGPSNKPIECRI